MLEPVAVALKFGFLAVLYLFLLWVARSALKDLSRPREAPAIGRAPEPPAAVAQGPAAGLPGIEARLVVERGRGLEPGMAFDVGGGLLIGRAADAGLHLEDGYASQAHARVEPRGGGFAIVDLDSTNGTYLNGRPLRGEAPLRLGDRVRIGETELRLAE